MGKMLRPAASSDSVGRLASSGLAEVFETFDALGALDVLEANDCALQTVVA